MRVDPEQMLIKNRIAAERRIEDPDAKCALNDDQQQRDPDDGRCENLDPSRRVE
jgi:hypothetical protein